MQIDLVKQLNRAQIACETDVDIRDLLIQTHSALMEWQAAQNFFQNAVEPDLIDCAIYNLEASRRRYLYLLDKVKQASGQQKEY